MPVSRAVNLQTNYLQYM